MLKAIVVVAVLSSAILAQSAAPDPGVVAINHSYEARIRLNGNVSTT